METSGCWGGQDHGMSSDETTGLEWRELIYDSGNRAQGWDYLSLLKPS